VVAGFNLAARKHQGAGGEVDLMVTLHHQHFQGRMIADKENGRRRANGR